MAKVFMASGIMSNILMANVTEPVWACKADCSE